MPTLVSRFIDQIAIGLSAVCIIHCLAVPFVIALLPVAAASMGGNSHFHEFMLWVIIPTSLVGLGLGVRIHRQYMLPLIGAAGLSIIIVAALWGHDVWHWWYEIGLSSAGSLVLAFAHWRNFSEVRRHHQHL